MTVITHVFNQEEFDKLLEASLHKYANSVEDARTQGAIVKLSCDWSAQLIDRVVEYAKDGYTQSQSLSPDIRLPSVFTAYMVKPQKLQKADIAAIKAEVEEAYKLELQRRYDSHIAKVTAETVQRKLKEKEKAQEEAYALLVATAEAEAIAAVGDRPE